MDPRKYKLTHPVFGRSSIRGIGFAANVLGRFDYNTVACLNVGESFIDADGDTWERIA